jgi:hypothetical protein
MKKPLILALLILLAGPSSPSSAGNLVKYKGQKAGQYCKNLEVGAKVNLPTGQKLICVRSSASAKPKWSKVAIQNNVTPKPSSSSPAPSESPKPISEPSPTPTPVNNEPSPTPTPVNNQPVFSNIRFQSYTIKAGESAQIFFTVTSSIGFSNPAGIVTLMHSSGANFSKILGVFGGGCVATSQTTLTCEGDVQISKTAPAGQYALNIIGFADNNNVSTTINQPVALTVTP